MSVNYDLEYTLDGDGNVVDQKPRGGITVEVVEGVVVRAGDALVLTFKERLSQEQARTIKAMAVAALPEGTKVLVVGNGAEITIVRPEENRHE